MHNQGGKRQLSRFLHLILLVVCISPNANAYYCDDNLCSAEQFCCGENICCNYVNTTVWRLVCVLISVIVFGIVVYAFFQLVLALIAIYYSTGDRARRDLEHQEEFHRHRHGFVADLQNGDVTLGYFVKRFLRRLGVHQSNHHSRQSQMMNPSKLNKSFRSISPPPSPSAKQLSTSNTSLMSAYEHEQHNGPFQ